MSGLARATSKGVVPQTATKTVPTGTAEAVTTTPTVLAMQGVIVKSLDSNTVTVYVGGSGVTTNGFPLEPGEDVTLPVRDPASIFVISGSASQVVRILWV